MLPDDGGVPDSGPPASSWVEACTQLVGPQCAAYAQCRPEIFASQYASTADCVAEHAAQCETQRQAPGNSATSDQLVQCAKAVGALSCAGFDALGDFPLGKQFDACRFTGTLPDGAFCIDDGQCTSGACAMRSWDACGTCVTPSATAACIVSAECPGQQLCRVNHCVPAGALGDRCDSEDPCRGSLTCRSGTCQARLAEGAACDKSVQDCALNLACAKATCVRAQAKIMGDRCGYESDGSWFKCGPGLQCIYSSTLGHNECVQAFDAGTACGTFSVECGVGLTCIEGTCAVLDAARCAVPDEAPPNSMYPARIPDPPRIVTKGTPVVLSAPKVVSITFDSDPGQGSYDTFIAGLGGSSFWPTTTQEYGVGPLTALPPVHESVALPSPVSDAQIRSWLVGQIDAGAVPPTDSETLYMVVLPPGTSSTRGSETSCNGFWGYHSAMSVNGVPTPFAVVDSCQLGLMTSTVVHEAVEAVTDPFYEPDGGSFLGFDRIDNDHLAWGIINVGLELGDVCESMPYSRFFETDLGSAQVQRTWSDAAIAAMHDPCVPAVAGQPFLAAVPDTPDVVSINWGGVTRPTKGISIALGASRTVVVDLLSDGPLDGPWYVTAYDIGWWLNGGDPQLHFSFDKQFGLNGDHLLLTITAVSQDATFKAEPFFLESRRGRNAHYWFAVVGNP
jgi:hypothetical protein